jgi:hypothetical protein
VSQTNGSIFDVLRLTFHAQPHSENCGFASVGQRIILLS